MKKIWCFLLLLSAAKAFSQDTLVSPLTGRVTGKVPFMEYGPGDDRLGGAKMTYLNEGILVTIVDSLDTDYIIQLSKKHLAFISKTSVILSPAQKKPYYLSSNWRITGDDKFDYLTINLEEKLPYKSIQQIEPSRIAIDLYGVTTNSNWITELGSAKEIKNAWFEQTEDDVMRVFIDLKHQQHWGHQIYYDSVGTRLIVKVKRQPPKTSLNKLRIAIDPGHGGTNVGATGVTSGITEKDYTLKIANVLAKQLKKKGATIFMTRTTDTTLEMPDRILMLRDYDPDFLISIHLNSSSTPLISGTSSYYRYIGFKPLAQEIHTEMLQLGLSNFGLTGNFNFALSGPTEYPNSLVEVAFLSSPTDEKKILNPAFHTSVAQKITKGIESWLKKLR